LSSTIYPIPLYHTHTLTSGQNGTINGGIKQAKTEIRLTTLFNPSALAPKTPTFSPFRKITSYRQYPFGRCTRRSERLRGQSTEIDRESDEWKYDRDLCYWYVAYLRGWRGSLMNRYFVLVPSWSFARWEIYAYVS
jgi:hypothetical protein